MEEVRGSSPLLPTKNKKIALFECDFLFFLVETRGFEPLAF